MISAVVLAAGESKRMGQPKMLLPWGNSTVLQTVISTLQESGLEDILVVTGGAKQQVETLVPASVEIVFNPDFTKSEMLGSIQAGLSAREQKSEAALIALGDQPQIEKTTIARILEEYRKTKNPIIVPSYQMHRGHPWLVRQALWTDILALQPPDTLREFLNRHADAIRYIPFDSPSILQDLDTPGDYLKYKP